jgi:hypothetical protein
MPLAVDGLQLMNFTIIGVEEIASVRNSSGVREMHGTLGPLNWTHSSAVLKIISYNVDSVAHLVCNTTEPRWH